MAILRKKKIVFEQLEGPDKTYVKSVGLKREQFGFWLRFIKEWWTPCPKCQEELAKLIIESETLILGNKDYEPPIELSKKYEIDDSSWKEVERRPSTKKEQKRLKEEWYE